MHLYTATRAHGLEALALLAASGGADYVRHRSFDLGSEDRGPVAAPYLRHRLVIGEEAVEAVQANFAAEPKAVFLEDVCAKTYASGWLACRPGLLRRYVSDLLSIDVETDSQPVLRRHLESAWDGCTGIACFDIWAKEVASGYLHSGSQRAFASIWVFTLKLPWQSGAQFFIRHLLEADLANVLLLWREVAGLEDAPAFCVTADDIAQLTVQRFRHTTGLETFAMQIVPEPPVAMTLTCPVSIAVDSGPAVLLVTCDDLHPESWPIEAVDVKGVLLVEPSDLYGWYSDQVLSFKLAGLDDAARRAAAHFNCQIARLPRDKGASEGGWNRQEDRDVRVWFEALDAPQLIAMVPGAGPSQDDIAMACQHLSHAHNPPQLRLIRRPWDQAFEAASRDGRAAFVDGISDVLTQLGVNHRP